MPKPAPKKVLEEEEDDFSSLAPREATSVALPPKVVKKKKGEKVVSERRRASSGGPSDPAEVLVPVILIVIGLGLNVVAALLVNSLHLTTGWAIGFRFALVATSTVITVGALFLAAAVLDTSYGFLHTAILKVIAIVMTEMWVGDLCSLIDMWYLEWLISFGTTYAMFKYFFELDDSEAIASMFVVRLVHYALGAFVFVALFTALFSGKVSLPEGMFDRAAIEAAAEAEAAGEGEGPAGQGDMGDDPDFDGDEDPAGMNL